MTLFEKVVNISIIVVLLVHMTIGTPFSIGMADEILNNETISADIPAVDNTIGTEDTTVELPLTEVVVGDGDTSTTITYTDDTTTAETLENTEEETTPDIVTVYEEQTGNTDSLSGSEETTPLSGNNNEDSTIIESSTNTSDSSSVPMNETDSLSTGDIVIPPIPDIVTTYPQQQVIISGGRIDATSLESYNVVDNNNPDITFCSYITYLNIKQLTNTGDDYIMRGDAVDIWSQLILNRTVTITSGDENTLTGIQYIFTGTHLSGQQFMNHLQTLYNQSGTTLFDIVTLKPKSAHDTTIGLSIHQSHRFIVFLGTDDLRYVLDPVRILTAEPLLLTDYLEYHILEQEDLQIIQSYTLQDTTDDSTPTDTLSASGIVVHSPMEFLSYVLQGLISSPNSGEAITNEVIFNTGFIYKTLDNKISAVIPQGLIIKTADGENLNWFQFGIEELSGENTELTLPFMYNNNFEFGVSGQHLIFSQPIQLTLATPDFEEGLQLNLLVQHEGQSWNTQGLTNNSDAICNPDGSVSAEDYSNIARVQDKKVVFYTCGASSFAIGYVGEFLSPNNWVRGITEQSDGKIIIGGDFVNVGGVARNYIYRLNADKTLDLVFNPNANNTVRTITQQPDGKVLIGGLFTTVGGVTRNRVARLNTDGTLDTSFVDPNVNNVVYSIALQSDGKIIIGGLFTSVGGVTRNRVARLNTDGSLDNTFDPNALSTVNTIVVQPDDKILLGGNFTQIGGVPRNYMARLNSDGSLDNTFDPNANNLLRTIALQPDGKILVGGGFTAIAGGTRNRVARLNSNGTLDTSFLDPNVNNTVNTVALQPDGNILIGGAFTTITTITRNRIARVTSTGALDTSFNPNASNSIFVLYYTTSNKIIAGGSFASINNVTQGNLSFIDDTIHDTSYNARPNNTVNKVEVAPDGKILIGGAFTTVGGVVLTGLARFDADGTLDTSFNANITSLIVNDVEVAPDGKILIGGTFTNVGGVTRNRIARLNNDGTLDTTFNPNASSTVNDIEIQPDGMIVVGGAFATIGGASRSRIARLTSTGAADATFNPNSNSTVNDIEIQPDGNILIGGAFTTITTITRNRIARVTSTGALDTTFNPNASSTVNKIAVQPDGMILVGGAFITIGGASRNRIARLTSTGVADATFNPNASSTVNDIHILPEDNSILLGGAFATIGGVARVKLAKLTSTGGLDNDINIPVAGLGTTAILNMDRDIEGNLIVGGSFTGFNNNINNTFLSRVGLNTTQKDILLWLRGDMGTSCTTNNCPLNTWNDQSPYSRNASSILGAGGYINYNNSAQVNFNPTVVLSGAELDLLNPTSVNNYTVFYVLSGTDIGPASSLLQDASTAQRFEQRNNQGRYGYTRYGLADYGSSLTTQWNQYQILRYNSANTTTMDISVQTPTTKFQQLGWSIGAVSNLGISEFSSTGTEKGSFSVAEILAYSGQLSSVNLNKVESYLATKYGLTLDQGGIGTNYVLNNGIATWTTGSAGTYNKDIAGIVRDDAMPLHQPKSQTINNSGDIIVESISGLANKRSLMRSNNGGSLATGSVIELIPGTSSRIARERKIQEKNGDVGTVRITYPVLASSINQSGDFYLATDIDGDFSSGSTLYTGTLLSGYRTFDINLDDNIYITFASLDLKDMVVWLKANNGVSTSAGLVTKRNDQSGKGNHIAQSNTSQQPEHKTSSELLNFNPVVDFDGTNDGLTTGDIFGGSAGEFNAFVVAKEDARQASNLFQLQRSSPRISTHYPYNNGFMYWDFGPCCTSGRVQTAAPFATGETTIGRFTNSPLLSKQQLHVNGRFLVGDSSAFITPTNQLSLGGDVPGGTSFYNGKIAEFIIYSVDLTDNNKNKIESYLATKYGITLSQNGIGQNYILSNNNITWSTGSAFNTYNKDIAGIARDDYIDLHQPKSQSINNTGDIIGEKIGGLSNGQSFMRGNNSGSLTNRSTTELPSGGINRIDRERKIQEKNGDVGTVRITYGIPTSQLTAGEIKLAVDSDGNFSAGSTLHTGVVLSGYRTFDVNIADNMYITFVKVSEGSLCIEGASTVNFSINASNVATADLALTDQFKVIDERGSSSGYYTTISISNLTGLLGNTISSSASIVIAGGGLMTISGTPNPDVVLDNTISSSRVNASSPVQFIKRNSGTTAGIYGTYAAQLAIQVSLPAYQSVDTYTGTITYTLYEN